MRVRTMTCVLGHTKKAMECPSCCDSKDAAWWRWYRGRTSSKDVRAKVAAVLADPSYFSAPAESDQP